MRCVARAGAVRAGAVRAGAVRADGNARGKANGPSLGRRAHLVALVATTTTATRGRAEEEPNARASVLRVERGGATIAAALRAARPGDRIVLEAGVQFDERVVVDVDGVTIETAGGGPKATLKHFTPTPYESTIEIRARGVTIRNVAVAHGSKSVANNYGVFATEGSSATFESCEVNSTTGAGFGIEGAEVALVDCAASGCASHGLVGLGDSSGLPGSGTVTLERCAFERNGANGALIRGGAVVHMSSCALNENGRYGVELIDCEGDVKGNQLRRNAKGPVSATRGAEDFVVVENNST